MQSNLITLAEWKALTPFEQGYVLYLQEELPGSELKGQPCPYPADSPEYGEFQKGSMRATLAVMDGEE